LVGWGGGGGGGGEGHLLAKIFFLRWIFAYVVQLKFEGVLFRSDSRYNDRVDCLCRPHNLTSTRPRLS
jgi:hypothetical protein